jgi:HlyD family secretion protein
MVFSRMNARRVLAILIVLAAVATAVTFVFRNRPTAAKSPVSAPQAEVPAEISIPAVLQASSTTLVAVPLNGKIESFKVEPGAEVFEGQLLGRIRSEGLESTREAAEVDLERAETRVKSLESLLTASRLEASRASADASRVRNDLERALKQYQRQKMMIEQGATPRKTFEKAEADYKALEEESKNLEAVALGAEERISSISRDLDAARKILEGKADELDHTKEQIGSGDIVSPVNGVVVSRRGQVGDQVHPSTTDLFAIATDLSTLQAVADVSPEFVKKMQPGLPVTLVIAELGGETLQGTIKELGEAKIIAEFANPNPAVRPGLTAQMRIKIP